jgi:retron-type reverse transcriptase
VQALLDEGHTWIVDADLKSYFDTIPKDRLMRRVEERIADGHVLARLRSYLDQGVMEGPAALRRRRRGHSARGGDQSPCWRTFISMDKLKTRIRELTPRRTCGNSLEHCLTQLNEGLGGWFGYFKHSHRTMFPPVDK